MLLDLLINNFDSTVSSCNTFDQRIILPESASIKPKRALKSRNKTKYLIYNYNSLYKVFRRHVPLKRRVEGIGGLIGVCLLALLLCANNWASIIGYETACQYQTRPTHSWAYSFTTFWGKNIITSHIFLTLFTSCSGPVAYWHQWWQVELSSEYRATVTPRTKKTYG